MASGGIVGRRVILRVTGEGLKPADAGSEHEFRVRKYKQGDILSAELRRPRNPAFYRLAHALGRLVAENVEQFTGLDCHAVLKRLQVEAAVECDTLALNFPGLGPCEYRVPRSLSFDSMGQEQFERFYASICAYLQRQYWPGIEPEKIEEMAQITADNV